jgi:hypothetical protein
MTKIYKYELKALDNQSIMLPEGAKILSVQTQYETPCIWVELNTELPSTVSHDFEIYGTGHTMPDCDRTYIGSFQLQGGALVFHLYEVF